MRKLLLAGAAIGFAVAGAALADEAARTPLYYQDPDGKPFYASVPKEAADGRDYKQVFDDSQAATVPAGPAAAPKPAPSGDRKVLYYRNPMGLPDTSPKPKKDSMGMDYLPVYADEGAQGEAPGTVKIDPGRLQTLGVRTAEAQLRPAAARTIRATGTLQFDERHLATVTTKVSGWIEHLAVAATGDPVRRGQVLAEIYAPDLVASEEEYLIASKMGGSIAAASDQRLRALDIPDNEIARLRRTGRSARRIAVLAPEAGVVIDKPAQEGMRIDAGAPLYKTADLSTLWLIAEVQEQDLGAIQPGEPAHASFVAFPGRRFDGKVDFIYPSLSAETRTARVRIVLSNRDGALRAQMYATIEIEGAAAGAPALSVPNSAVLDSGARQVVLVAGGEGRFAPRTVQLGIHGDDWVQVLTGLAPGESVVTGANFLIDAESNLRAALQGFANGADAKSSEPGAAP